MLGDCEPSDAEVTRTIFSRAVYETAAPDCTEQQRNAWAPPLTDLTGRNETLLSNRTALAVEDGQAVGSTDASSSGGYVDMMFVCTDHTGRGIAALLLDAVLGRAARQGAPKSTTHASLTARGFFEHEGFGVVEEGHPIMRGVVLTNFVMTKRPCLRLRRGGCRRRRRSRSRACSAVALKSHGERRERSAGTFLRSCPNEPTGSIRTTA